MLPPTHPRIKRTYGKAPARPRISFSSSSSYYSSDPPTEIESKAHEEPSPVTRKRKHSSGHTLESFLVAGPSTKKPKKRNMLSDKKNDPDPAAKPESSTKLKQTRLLIAPSFKTCSQCQLTYTCDPHDLQLHKEHCARVKKGVEWEHDEARVEGSDVEVLNDDFKLKTGEKARIVSFQATIGGKVGSKFSSLLRTINRTLSSPDLSKTALEASRVYLCLVRSSSKTREKIVGCVVAQAISTAMAVSTSSTRNNLICVDGEEGGLYCDPTPLPTPLGIPRLFVASEYRKRGIAIALLDAAAQTFVRGYELDPTKGEVAFSQPTSTGRAVMNTWGRGGVRIFQEA